MSPRVRTVVLAALAILVVGGASAVIVNRRAADDVSVVAEEPLTGQPFIAPEETLDGDGEPVLEVVASDRIRVMASSFLQPDGAITYTPENTIDGNLDTAWNSDSAADDGRGQVLTFRFAEPIDLRKISLVNGYAKGVDIYDANHRLKELIITTDTVSRPVSLFDSTDEQDIVFGFGFTSKVEIEVVDVFVGTGFANPALTADLALTEISFLAVAADG